MRKLILILATTPLALLENVAYSQDKKPLIDLPDNQLQLKMKALENRIQAQKDQLEKLSKDANSDSPASCPEPQAAPKCPSVNVQNVHAVKSGSSPEIELLKKELAEKDSELKKKTKEIANLKNALAQASKSSLAKAAAAAPAPESTPTASAQPAQTTAAVTESSSENFESRILLQFGYGPNGTQESPVGNTGAVSVVTKYSAVFGVTYERQLTPSWSFGITALSNKTVLGSVGYGVEWW